MQPSSTELILILKEQLFKASSLGVAIRFEPITTEQIGVAGLGITFHAKPKVVANAKQSINTIGLDGVLYFLGFKDSYLNM